MDLTKTHPRSVHEKFAGVVQLGRTIDKARASLEGKLGEYHYNCAMDQGVFQFLGVENHEAFAKEVGKRSDAAVEEWVRERYVDKKSPAEIARWNEEWLRHGPDPGSDGEKYFLNLRDQVAPGRTDITTWPDLLDADEGRPVPQRSVA